MAVLRLAVAMVLGIGLPFLVQFVDRRRMSATMRTRTWNVATWGASLYAFGPLSLLGWFWVTRPRGRRVVLGAFFTGLVLATLEGADAILCVAVGMGRPDLVNVGLALAGGWAGGVVLLGLLEGIATLRGRQ